MEKMKENINKKKADIAGQKKSSQGFNKTKISSDTIQSKTRNISSNKKIRLSQELRERIRSEILKGRSKIEIVRMLENENI